VARKADGCNTLVQQSKWKKGRGTHEVNADGADVALCVCVVREPKQEARLAYTGVANEQKLE